MKALALGAALMLPSLAFADSACISLEGSTLINQCDSCTEVTARELQPPAQRAAGLFTGVSRTVRLEGKTRATLSGGDRWAISDLSSCR